LLYNAFDTVLLHEQSKKSFDSGYRIIKYRQDSYA
jgi:hypothetical protein